MIEEKDFANEIGEIIETARKASGLSRQQIADMFQVNNQSYIYAIEKTGAKLPLFRFFQLLQIFPPAIAKKMLDDALRVIDFVQDDRAETTLDKIRELLNA